MRKVGSRPYRNYTEETLNNAVKEYQKSNLVEISKKYNIPYVTLYRKINGLNLLNPGHSTALSASDEKAIVKAICVLQSGVFLLNPVT